MRRLMIVMLLGCVPRAVIAQAETADALQAGAAALIDSIEAAFECALTLHGRPQFDDFAQKWLVAYSAAGDGCDDASEALQREGAQIEALFVRRPNLDQVKTAIGEMMRTVRRGFRCRISLREEPRLDEESGVWSAAILTSGADCDDAYGELVRQGRTLRVAFVRTVDRQDFLLR